MRGNTFKTTHQQDTKTFKNFDKSKGSGNESKPYQANSQTQQFWMAKNRGAKSSMGVQSEYYNIVTHGERFKTISNKPMLKKVNGISEYKQDTHITAPNYNKDY